MQYIQMMQMNIYSYMFGVYRVPGVKSDVKCCDHPSNWRHPVGPSSPVKLQCMLELYMRHDHLVQALCHPERGHRQHLLRQGAGVVSGGEDQQMFAGCGEWRSFCINLNTHELVFTRWPNLSAHPVVW